MIAKRTYGCIVGLLLIVALPFDATSQTVKLGPPDNAALVYWQAFAVMPIQTESEVQQIPDWRTMPLDDSAADLVNRGANALKLMHRAAQIGRCDWGVDFYDGAETLLPHLAKARELARLMLLRARMRFEQRQWDDAIDDVAATLRMSRQIGPNGTLIDALVAYAIENMAVICLSDHIAAMPESSRAKLIAHLSSLKPRYNIKQAILLERDVFLSWAIRQIDAGRRPQMAASLGLNDVDGAQAQFNVLTDDQLRKMFVDARPYYDRVYAMMDLPLDQFLRESAPFIEEIKQTDNLAVRYLFPAHDKARLAEARTAALAAMLRAAIVRLQEGDDAFNAIRDPFGDGPFAVRQVDGGFELESKLVYRDEPVRLMIAGPQ